MERVKRFVRRMFILPVWQTALIAPACFALLIWALTHENPPLIDHIAYQLSVYALVITVTAGMRVIPAVKEWLRHNRFIHSPFSRLLIRDAAFRDWFILCLSIGWNLFYALVKLIAGALLGSTWFKLMGIYYLVLALLRTIIVRPVGKRPVEMTQSDGRDSPQRQALTKKQALSEWRRYRMCGEVLLVMNLVLMMVVAQLVTQKGRFRYPGALIYVMAAYAFYAVISATVRLVRYHRREDALMSAAKAISLTAAMVSLLSLETALIDRFGNGESAFHYIITGVLGGGVCLLELGIALTMIQRGSTMIAQIKSAPD